MELVCLQERLQDKEFCLQKHINKKKQKTLVEVKKVCIFATANRKISRVI